MQQNVTEIVSVENQINLFFHNHSLGKLLRQCNIKKEKGVSLEILFQFLLALAFTGKNLFRHMEPSGSFDGIFKDAAYRFQNSVRANWRRFLLLLSTRIIVSSLEPMTDESNRKVLIADDTVFLRDRSKHVELLARIHDHNTGRYHKGFRMLTMGWSDGSSFVPILLSLLSSATEKNRLVPMRDDLDKRTNGYKRRQESTRKSPDVLVDFIEVFFKMAKSFLQLAKECQSRSYDAMVAHATLVCCRYLILEIGKRTTADPRTLGTLFHATCDEIRQASFTEALALLLKLLEQTLNAVVEFSKEQVEHLVQQFIEQLQPVFRGRLLLLTPTSV